MVHYSFMERHHKIVIAMILVLALLILYWLRMILAPFAMALVLAYLLRPLVEFWQGKGFTRLKAIILTYILLLAVALLVGNYVIPIFWRQLNILMASIPNYTMQMQGWLEDFYDGYQRFQIPEALRQEIDFALQRVEGILTTGIGGLIDRLLGLASYFFSIVITPVLAFYILNDQEKISNKLKDFLPIKWRYKLFHLWQEIDCQLIRYIKGYLLVAMSVGLLTSIGFTLIGLEFPFLLGFTVGAAEVIPYFGPIIGAIPAFAMGILHSKSKAILALLVIFLIQQIEINILSPKIIGSSVGIHPLVVVFVLLLGNKIYGILGMLLAVPTTVTLRVLWRHLLLEALMKLELR